MNNGHKHQLEHTHHHHNYPEDVKGLDTIIILSVIINTAYVVIEAAVGVWQGSMGLVSDAGHNLSDVFSLLLVLVGFRLAAVKTSRSYTYGYKKSTVLISLLNAIILLVAVGAIVIESIHKIRTPETVNGIAVTWTAGVGIVVNGITAMMLMKGQKDDLNVKGAFLHMAADTLVSVGVVVAGVVITLTGWNFIDPIISIIIACIILLSTWNLLSESLRLLIDGTPSEIDVTKVEEVFGSNPNVVNAHHVHIWAISTTEVALTAHVVVNRNGNTPVSDVEQIKEQLKEELKHVGIKHSTLELEDCDNHCNNMNYCGE